MSVNEGQTFINENGFDPKELSMFYDLIPFLFEDYFNNGMSAPDANLKAAIDLIDIVNLIPRNFKGAHLYAANVHSNMYGIVKLFNNRSEINHFFNSHVSEIHETLKHQDIPDVSRKSIAKIFKEIFPFLQSCDTSIIQHIQPVNTLNKKIEAIRVFVAISELKSALEFLFKIRKIFFSLDGVGLFAIPFTINLNKRINGIINYDGRILFAPSSGVFFDGLKIQQIQRCKICWKFLLIKSGKNNVDKTCSPACAELLKKKKGKELYEKNSLIFNHDRRDRKVRASSKPDGGTVDQYTEKMFSTKMYGDEAKTKLYVAWTETFIHQKGAIKRKEREELTCIQTKYNRILLDHEIFENYLPVLMQSLRKRSEYILTEIVVPTFVFTYFVRFATSIESDKLEKVWRSASYTDLRKLRSTRDLDYWEREKLISDKFDDLINKAESKMASLGMPQLESRTRKHNALLARCEVMATALVENLPIITADETFYREILPEDNNQNIEVIKAADFFGKYKLNRS
jgi:hypothetical protein